MKTISLTLNIITRVIELPELWAKVEKNINKQMLTPEVAYDLIKLLKYAKTPTKCVAVIARTAKLFG